MGAGPGLAQFVLGPASDNFTSKLDKALKHLLEIENSRLPVNNGQIDYAK